MREVADKVLDDSFGTALDGASKDFAESSSSLAICVRTGACLDLFSCLPRSSKASAIRSQSFHSPSGPERGLHLPLVFQSDYEHLQPESG